MIFRDKDKLKKNIDRKQTQIPVLFRHHKVVGHQVYKSIEKNEKANFGQKLEEAGITVTVQNMDNCAGGDKIYEQYDERTDHS